MLMPSGRIASYSPERREQMADKFQADLREARDTKDSVITCDCDREKQLRLYTRPVAGSDRLALRRYPNTGPLHAADCQYYERVNRDGGARTYSAACIREDEEGELHISLRYPLKVRDNIADDQSGELLPPRQQRAGARQASMSFLGLLHLLWENTQRNIWYPWFEGRRDLKNLMYALYNEATKIKQGRTRLSRVLMLQGETTRNQEAFTHASQSHSRLVLISELSGWTAEKETGTGLLPVVLGKPAPFLNMDVNRWQNTLTRFPHARAWWRAGGKVIAIAVTDVPDDGPQYRRATVRQVCLMMVSDRWIPLDSAFEGEVENKLVAEGRAFIKPLLFDSAEDEYLPDFILSDTANGCCPMEVWGMETEHYLAHKAGKTAWYDQEYEEDWWGWDAAARAAMPDFPPTVRYRAQ
ncbi:DUF1173 family protein [Scandinavium sp. NPDC088450]|uniref:DUF1173 family protein n=1 Tax=Scandinavium sp. NPDC088450 TaxID=3364514 RepID=UPI00384B6507